MARGKLGRPQNALSPTLQRAREPSAHKGARALGSLVHRVKGGCASNYEPEGSPDWDNAAVPLEWNNLSDIPPRTYVCGFCEDKVGPYRGYHGVGRFPGHDLPIFIFVCSSCGRPTFIDEQDEQWPGVTYGAH